MAKKKGLSLPIVYNSDGYDSVETLQLIDGMIDIYMPDMKYSDPQVSGEFSNAVDYPLVNRAAIREMYRQVGDLEIIKGVAVRRLLIRHLVLPNNLAGSFETIDFLAEQIGTGTAINVMDQYRPCFNAYSHPKINRHPAADEIETICNYAIKKELRIID